MKASVVFAMVSAMMAPSSAAMPAPMKNYTNATLPYLPLGVAVEVRGEKENGMPACSVPCIENAIQKMTDCDVTDYACACKHHGKISSAASGCVVGSCGLKKALKVVAPAVKKLCKEEAKKAEEKEGEKEKRQLVVLDEDYFQGVENMDEYVGEDEEGDEEEEEEEEEAEECNDEDKKEEQQ
ncbi:hypothetical protein ACSS6W_006152 [Trichoderma asperelloides]